jgi:hypothetical protein
VVSLDRPPASPAQPIAFIATDLGDGRAVQMGDNFFGPRNEGAPK